jgi:glycerate 2-kinase
MLAQNHRNLLEKWFRDTMHAVDPRRRLPTLLQYDGDSIRWSGGAAHLSQFRNIWVFGAGKAAANIAASLHELLGDRIKGGIVITGTPDKVESGPILQLLGDHPLPNINSIHSTEKLLQLAGKIESDDLVFFCITGGASAMLCKPIDGISLAEKQARFDELLRSGASIHEINAERKRLSKVKGGKLLEYFATKHLINLIISDVPGDDPASIGSGPTISDTASANSIDTASANSIDTASANSIDTTSGTVSVSGTTSDTSSISDTSSDTSSNNIIWVCKPIDGANHVAEIAKNDGFRSVVASDNYSGPVEKVANSIINDIRKVISKQPLEKTALIYYGESQVRVTNSNGKGGRNQHLSLILAEMLQEFPENHIKITILSAGTDGIDGNTSAAGAFCDNQSVILAKKHGLNPAEYLRNFDSNTFFSKLGDILTTGPTGNNLMDLQIVIIEQNV